MTRSTELTNLLTAGAEGLSPKLVAALPEPWRFRRLSELSYDLDDTPLVTAVKAALLLGQPLILAGDPGVGKTTLAGALSARLGVPMLPPTQVKSSTTGLDFFYYFDEVARFRDAGPGGDRSEGLKHYVRFSSLGRAILRSAGPNAEVSTRSVAMNEIMGESDWTPPLTLGQLFPREFDDEGPVRSVVLLDEIDKAARDAPNDILGEIEDMRFHIRELDIGVAASTPTWPIVLITSNSERSLPDAFLRRCVFHWIDYPNDERLAKILAAHCGRDWGVCADDKIVTSTVALFHELRSRVENKKPATAELISFLVALLELGFPRDGEIDPAGERVQNAIGILVKTRIDDEKVRETLPFAAT
jgi:MoxR-like ATPase